MKHVGLNVAADPLFIGSYVGVGGGMLIIVADDPVCTALRMNRIRGITRRLQSSRCLNRQIRRSALSLKAGFELSEKYDTPVIIRLSTRISHSQGPVELSDRFEHELVDYIKDPSKRVMTPANAKPDI